MEQTLVTYLLAATGLTGLVGTRIWWTERPQKDRALPAIVLHRITGIRSYSFQGASGLVQSRVQFDCLADTPDDAMAVRDAVVVLLSGAHFADTGTEAQGCFLEDERHDFEKEGAERFHRVSLDFLIWHTE